jgi:RNA polymerase sigma factor (sigma-70 family)
VTLWPEREETTVRGPTRDLVSRLQDGEGEAWFEFWEVFGPLVERWVERIGGRYFTPETVRDIGQETLARVSQEVRKFDPDRGARFSTWLYGVTRYIVMTELSYRNTQKRGAGVRPGSLDAMELDPAGGEACPPPEDYERAALRAKVYRAIRVAAGEAELLEFEAYRLRVAEDHTGKEIARALGVSEASVSRYLQRFRGRLRTAVMRTLQEYSFSDLEVEEALTRTGLQAHDDRLFDEAISHIYLSEEQARQGYGELGNTARAVVGEV